MATLVIGSGNLRGGVRLSLRQKLISLPDSRLSFREGDVWLQLMNPVGSFGISVLFFQGN